MILLLIHIILDLLNTGDINPCAIVVLAAIDGLSKYGMVNARNVLPKIIKFSEESNKLFRLHLMTKS
jgi:hypothetical protein